MFSAPIFLAQAIELTGFQAESGRVENFGIGRNSTDMLIRDLTLRV